VDFVPGADAEHAMVGNRDDLVDLAKLLSVDVQELEKALLSRVIAAGGHVVEKQLNVNDALYARDAFAKVLQYFTKWLQSSHVLTDMDVQNSSYSLVISCLAVCWRICK
jgi:hypothetical protein